MIEKYFYNPFFIRLKLIKYKYFYKIKYWYLYFKI